MTQNSVKPTCFLDTEEVLLGVVLLWFFGEAAVDGGVVALGWLAAPNAAKNKEKRMTQMSILSVRAKSNINPTSQHQSGDLIFRQFRIITLSDDRIVYRTGIH